MAPRLWGPDLFPPTSRASAQKPWDCSLPRSGERRRVHNSWRIWEHTGPMVRGQHQNLGPGRALPSIRQVGTQGPQTLSVPSDFLPVREPTLRPPPSPSLSPALCSLPAAAHTLWGRPMGCTW